MVDENVAIGGASQQKHVDACQRGIRCRVWVSDGAAVVTECKATLWRLAKYDCGYRTTTRCALIGTGCIRMYVHMLTQYSGVRVYIHRGALRQRNTR